MKLETLLLLIVVINLFVHSMATRERDTKIQINQEKIIHLLTTKKEIL